MKASATADRHQRQQEEQRPVEADGTAEQRTRDGGRDGGARPQPRQRGDRCVRGPGPPRPSARLRDPRDQRRHDQRRRRRRARRRRARRRRSALIRRAARRARPLARGPHRGQRAGYAGEQLELQDRLVHQQVEARDQDPVRRRRRDRGRPRVVDDLEDHRDVGAPRDQARRPGPRPGSSRRPRRRRPAPSARVATSTVGADGWAATAAAASAARSALRASSRTRRRAEVAQRQRRSRPPWRRRRARWRRAPGRRTAPGRRRPRRAGRCCRRARRRRARAPACWRPPASRARSVTVPTELERPALERHRQRQPAPGLVEAGHERRQPVVRHPDGVVRPSVEPGRGVPRPVQDRRERVGDRVTQDGARIEHVSSGRTGSRSSRGAPA